LSDSFFLLFSLFKQKELIDINNNENLPISSFLNCFLVFGGGLG